MPSLLATLLLAQANPWLDQARARVKALEFSEAVEVLQVARQVPDLDERQRGVVLELLATCQVALGQRASAEETYVALLTASPSWTLSRETTSPKILELFEATKRRLYPLDEVRLVEEPGAPGQIRLRVVDPWNRVEELVRAERGSEGRWAPASLRRQGDVVTFEPRVPSSGTLSWYVVARRGEEILATVGTAEQPRTVTAPAFVVAPAAEAPRARPTRTAAFVALGVGAVALGVATGLQVDAAAAARAARDATRPPGDWADTARAANERARVEARWAAGLFAGAGVCGAAAVVLFTW